ncbi:FG-GAP-like repeat-containing protein [Streptomyces sporangiiformans]|uniref:FG-GAP-like repeat-containing protein n=1 Tax=Streptomyces sporangiiformans TaxID=2315329 RepID=UPI001F095D3A|nr:FG-GAP-like repeat-containing protein [Streptomyces sporangiiformans]
MGNLSRRTTHAYKPLSLKRRAWLTIGAVVLGGAGAVTYAMADPSSGPAADVARGKRPVKVHDLAMKSDGTGRRVARTGTDAFSLLGVSWTGSATPLDGTAQVRTRSSETGKWTGWQSLDLEAHPVDKAEPDAKEARGASDPLWVGPSNGVEARVVAADGSASAGLPKGLELNLVDPGVTSAEAKNKGLATGSGTGSGTGMENAAFVAEDPTGSPSPSEDAASPSPGEDAAGSPSPSQSESTEPPADDTLSPSPTGSATESASASPEPDPVPSPPPSTVTQPPIVSRAAWGADESTVDDPPEYIEKVSAVFVHHTVGTNDYSCAESPSLVRGIMAYHIQVEKWNDLGYNFLVDKCGRIFEGRAGGMDLPVRGAHTYGFNGDSTGIAVLGDFEGAAATSTTPAKPAGKPTRAALESVARVAAWKLGQYEGDPSGQVTLTAAADTGVWKAGQQATLNTISGHRDGFATACPGKNLYAKLGEIRRFAAGAGKNAAILTADFNRDGINDFAAGVPQASSSVGNVVIVPGGLNGPVSASKLKLTQSSAGVPGISEKGDSWGAATAWGDINGDGYADLAIGAPGEDDASHVDRGAVTILYGPKFDTGADTMALGDDYNMNSAKFGATVAVGDFNADGKADVFTAATGTGGNWAARFDDGHEVAGDLTTASGALAYADATSGDFNRDGYADVALNYRDQSGAGKVTWFKGSKALGLSKVSTLSVKGGRSIAAGDVNGNGYDDIVIGQPYTSESGANAGGQVTMVPGTSTGFTTTGMTTIHQGTTGVEGAAESGDALGTSVSVGDFNADGYADVLTGAPNEDITRSGTNRSNAGAVWLLKGTSSGLTGSGSLSYSQDTTGIPGSTEKDDKLGSAVSLTDLSGRGFGHLLLGTEGEDAGTGTLLYLPSTASGVVLSKAAYYGITQLGTPTGARLGQVLTP